MKTRIHIVRHGLSASNLDLEVNRRMPDHAIELAPAGHEQALEAGRVLARHILGVGEDTGGFHHRRVRLLVSPYKRTRQTADGIAKSLQEHGIEFDRRENLQLREQGFGLFDGIPDAELPVIFPMEFAHYEKHTRFEGEFYAPMPLGESRAMVADRVRATFGTILRDLSGTSSPPVTDMIVVTHGVTGRCFRMGWFNRPWEWCENEPNPGNCAITTIEGEQGRGWTETETFKGYVHRRPSEQDRREEGHVGPDDEQPAGTETAE